MLLVTWNVNSLNARLPRLLELLEVHAPAVVCLQETKVDTEQLPRDALAQAGYAVADHSAGRWAGVATLTREGLDVADVGRGLPGEPAPEEARWLEATVDGIRVVTAYVPNGRAVGHEQYEAKLRFFAAAAERIAELRATRTPVVLTGDLNVCPQDVDCYDPAAFAESTHLTEPERAGFRSLLDAGLHDRFRERHPDEPGFTWWDYRAGHFHKKLGLRIDFVLTSPDLEVGEVGIDRGFRKGPKPSDHAPLLAELDLGPG